MNTKDTYVGRFFTNGNSTIKILKEDTKRGTLIYECENGIKGILSIPTLKNKYSEITPK